MRARMVLRHGLIVAAGIFALLGLPLIGSGYLTRLVLGGADAVSGASVIIAQPSGEYIVLINRAMHPDEAKLGEWIRFFGNEEISYIFEDISCSVAIGDGGAKQMAESYKSRLPENQMAVRQEDATLLVSRIENGKFDIAILSREMAEAYRAGRTGGGTERIDVVGESGAEEIAAQAASGDGDSAAGTQIEPEAGASAAGGAA